MEEKGIDRHPGRLIEQLQNVQFRQRRVIQRLQAENARLINDLVDVRQERDAFRGKAARARRENAELQNCLEEALTEYQDLKRERATLVTTLVHTRGRSANMGSKVLDMFSVLNDEGQTESPLTAETTGTTNMEKAARPDFRPYLNRELPNPLKSEPPQPDHPMSTPVTACNNPRGVPMIQTSLFKDCCATL